MVWMLFPPSIILIYFDYKEIVAAYGLLYIGLAFVARVATGTIKRWIGCFLQ